MRIEKVKTYCWVKKKNMLDFVTNKYYVRNTIYNLKNGKLKKQIRKSN